MASLKRVAPAFTPRGTAKKVRANAPALSPATLTLLAANAAQAKEIKRMRKEAEEAAEERQRMRKLLPGAHAPGAHDRLAQANVLCGIIQRCGPKVGVSSCVSRPPSQCNGHPHWYTRVVADCSHHPRGRLCLSPHAQPSQSNEVAKQVHGRRNSKHHPPHLLPTRTARRFRADPHAPQVLHRPPLTRSTTLPFPLTGACASRPPPHAHHRSCTSSSASRHCSRP